MTDEDRQHVVDANDEELRRITHENLKVFAKFTSENCATCELLSPPFAKFAADPGYEGIAFVRLASDENPVARQLMDQRVAPFFVSYCQGRLLECDTRTTEEEVKSQLDRLRRYVPRH